MPEIKLQNAATLVKGFLNAMEDRDLILAKSFLSNNFKSVFPGNKVFSSLEDLTIWSKKRYQWIRKNYDHFDKLKTDTTIIIYCYGTLYGEWLNGGTFSEIRFIDRFTIKDDKILGQLVWNDLSEYK